MKEASKSDALVYGYGGALSVAAPNVSIADCVFEGNEAAEGGAIWLDVSTIAFKVANTTFRSNYAGYAGAALSVLGSSGDYTSNAVIEMSHVLAVDNICETSDGEKKGGAFAYLNGGHLSIHASEFFNNRANNEVASGLALRYVDADLYSVHADGDVLLSNSVVSRTYCANLSYVDAPNVPTTRYLTHNPRECSLCPPGADWHGAPTYACVACPPGTSKAEGNATCLPCPAGFVQDRAGMAGCGLCPENKVPNSNADACDTCTDLGDPHLGATPGDAARSCAGTSLGRGDAAANNVDSSWAAAVLSCVSRTIRVVSAASTRPSPPRWLPLFRPTCSLVGYDAGVFVPRGLLRAARRRGRL